MSIGQNNIVKSNAPKSFFESAKPVLSSSVTYNQGDFIAFDTTNKVLKVAGTADIDNLLGIARQTIVNGIAPSPIPGTAVDASQALDDLAGPVYDVVAFFTLKSGDSFNPGDKVYLTTDPQTVTSVDPGTGKNCGIYVDKAKASVAAGTVGNVRVGARYLQSGTVF